MYEYTLPAPEFEPVIARHWAKGHSILLKPPHLSALCTLLCYSRLKSPFIDPDPVLDPLISWCQSAYKASHIGLWSEGTLPEFVMK